MTITIKEIVNRLENLKETAYEDTTESIVEEIDNIIMDISDEHMQDDGFLADDGLDSYLSKLPS